MRVELRLAQHLSLWRRFRTMCSGYFSSKCGEVMTSLKSIDGSWKESARTGRVAAQCIIHYVSLVY